MNTSSLVNSAPSVDDINHQFEEKEAQRKAQDLGLEYVDLAKFPINPDVLHLLPLEQAQSMQVVPFYRNGYQIKLAAVDPDFRGKLKLQEFLESQRFVVTWCLASARGVQQVLSLYHSDLVEKKTVTLKQEFAEGDDVTLESEFVSFGDLQAQLHTLSATQALNEIEVAAVRLKASDIHLQPYEDHVQLRFRLDGVLHDIARLDLDNAKKLVNHIKYQAGMKSNISHIPQDGSLTFMVNNRKVDLRISTLPTEQIESVVMRVLDSRKGLKDFSELGFHAQTEKIIGRALRRKSGMVLVTGPTGSGKTTTLYAMLKQLNDSERKLVSLEDPVEYHLPGVTQSPVDERSDYTFSNGLKALLRHDPDVILIGEIRETSTAKLASEAALTGHIVLSSLHTNSALGAIARLRNLGLENFNIAAAVNAVFAQRLVRKVCPHCGKKHVVDLAEHQRVQDLLPTLGRTYPELDIVQQTKKEDSGEVKKLLLVPQPEGCAKCSHTGYLGQTVICETLWFTEEIANAVATGASEQELRKLIGEQGTLFSDGLRKVLLGETTLDEVYRVAG